MPFAQERTTLRGKLHTLLPDEGLATVERWLQTTSIAVPRRQQHAPLLDALIEATGRRAATALAAYRLSIRAQANVLYRLSP